LKESKPVNLIVIGVGVAQLRDPSPQFENKYPEIGDICPLFFDF
jgi:hypothetical protein